MLNNKLKNYKHRLAWHFTLYVFLIILASLILAGFFAIMMLRLNIWPMAHFSPIPLIIYLFGISAVIGFCISYLISRRSLKNMNVFIDAIQEVANGNFDIKIDPKDAGMLEDIAVKFNAMTVELSSIETLRNDFATNFSHEFKTPIVSIRGFAKLLKETDLPETEKQEYLSIIFDESNRLTQLATNTLVLSKLESQSVISEKRQYSLDEQLRQSLLLLENAWTKKQITAELNLPSITYNGNEDLVQQIWINLLSNAVKFTGEGGKIEITATSNEREATVIISDNGCGMGEETQKHIFEKYYQGDTSRSTSGNGLGLSIVKRIVDLCGGTISVSSKPGKGAVFIVSLPN